jgi:hypothetical protein
LGVPEIRRLKQLEDENAKRLVADLTLDRAMLQDVLRRKWRGPRFGAMSRAISRRLTTSATDGPAGRRDSTDRPSATGSAAPRRRNCGCG